jgi:anti-sigma factor RsiW
MTIPDESLMAYADGELDEATRATIEAAMREDPEIRKRVARHRALRAAMQGTLSTVLDEPVPERLIAAARGRAATATPQSNVVDLSKARSETGQSPPDRPRWQPVAMAASLLLGVTLGYLGWHGSNTLVKTSASGGLVASAALAEALSTQLSSDRSAGLAATTGLSFRDKSGDFCRTFALTGAEAGTGLACREGSAWKIKVLAQSAHPSSDPANYRQAASADSPAVRAAVEESIDGEPLDQSGEIAARQSGWAATRPH